MGERHTEEPREIEKNRLDDYTKKLYEKYGFDENSTLEVIEPKAIELLNDVRTCLDGAELVLGRRVDAKEEEIMRILYIPLDANEKYGLLLLKKTVEQMPKEKEENQF